MRTLCEVRWVKDGTEGDDEPKYDRGRYWLLHFGIRYDIIYNAEGGAMPVNYTVAVCQHYESGVVECFLPEQLRIIGEERKT
jgi:hypothetical protein